jgi:hypothetical protein
MNNHNPNVESLKSGFPSRRNATPPGYRNVRVLVPLDLHWRISAYAVQSKMNIPSFVLATLHNATPITHPMGSGSRGSSAAMESPTIDGPGLFVDPPQVQASPTTKGSEPGQLVEATSTDLPLLCPNASCTQPSANDPIPERKTTRA